MDRDSHHIDLGPNRRGFTLVEAIISTLIVGVMFTAALSTLAASKISQHKLSVSSQGHLLAEALMAEILQQEYEEPDEAVTFGSEPTESTATRTDFDDVDDYHNWSSSPPVARDGANLVDSDRWDRRVTVEWVLATDPSSVQGSESNVKRITVAVEYDGVPQVSLVALRASDDGGGLL